MSLCCNTPNRITQNDFTGCDGKPWSNEFLEYHIALSVQDENYERAAECKKELDRRLSAVNQEKIVI